MIVKNDDKFNFIWDAGRPNLYCDEDHLIWNNFHEIVKISPIEVKVSSAFFMIEEMLTQKSGYGGEGMQYCFWFKTEEDKRILVAQLKAATPELMWRD